MINNIDELITCLKRNNCIVSCIWDEKIERYVFESIENYEGIITLGNGAVSFVMDEAELISKFPIDKKKFMEINAFINVYDMDSIKDDVYADHNGDLYWGEHEVTEIVETNDEIDCPDDDEIATTDPKELQLRIEVMGRLFNAYSHLDFTDLCEMINYRGGLEFTEANCNGLSAEDYFEDTSEIKVEELQDYIYAISMACYNRWLYEHNDSEEKDTEYVQNNILVSITKDGSVCGIDYRPISVVSEN